VLDEHKLTAVLYPSLRRRPARIGEAQPGTVCQVSAHSGLPALAVPAGFTTDEVPIGMELLGRAFSESELLSLGYSIEKTLNLRRPPFSTPALVSGKRPLPRTVTVGALRFTYDATMSRLQYDMNDENELSRIAAIWLHSGTVEKPGAARHQLYVAGQSAGGTVTLSAADRRDLADGRLLIRVYAHGSTRPIDTSLRLDR
jgi:hypothetical protein